MDGAARAARRQGSRAVRPLARLAVVAAAWSCASASIPPGGPETYDPPKVLRARPDTNAVNVRAGGVTYSFDKVVSERPVGAADLGALFLISPSHGAPNVSWRRTTISVSPKGGFRPNTTYRVRMLSGLADLEGNVDSTGSVIVFSTGATIARGNLRGIVFDWMAEKVAPQAFIEAFPLPTDRDSTRYIAQADSMGRFDLGNVPAGRYVLRASVDQNKNRYLDPRELYDTMTVTLADSLRREILTFVHDTIGAGIQTVTIVDSLTLRVQMDRALDTTFVIDTTHFTLRAKDSTLVRIARALSRRADEARREDSLRTKAIQDSVQKAAKADSAKADSAKGDTARAPRPAPPPTTRRALPPPTRRSVDSVVARLTGRDTARKEPPPKPSIPAPVNEIILRLATPLQPSTSYRLRAVDMRTLLKRTRTSERVFNTPKPRKAADSTAKDSSRARRDTSAARDSSARRDTSAARDSSARRDTTRRDTSATGRDASVGASTATHPEAPTARPQPVTPIADDRVRWLAVARAPSR